MKLKVIAVLSLAALLVSCGGGGPAAGGPPFTGGIYLVTYIYHTQTNVLVAQKGVGVQGNLASQHQTSCSNNGTQTLFGGTTEKHGSYTCPQCEVNAVWNLLINYNLVVGACSSS